MTAVPLHLQQVCYAPPVAAGSETCAPQPAAARIMDHDLLQQISCDPPEDVQPHVQNALQARPVSTCSFGVDVQTAEQSVSSMLCSEYCWSRVAMPSLHRQKVTHVQIPAQRVRLLCRGPDGRQLPSQVGGVAHLRCLGSLPCSLCVPAAQCMQLCPDPVVCVAPAYPWGLSLCSAAGFQPANSCAFARFVCHSASRRSWFGGSCAQQDQCML